MARRPEFPKQDDVLTEEELKRFRHGLAHLAPSHIEQEYRTLLEKCKLRPGMLPAPRLMQQLVAVWKTLWKWRRVRESPGRAA